LVDEALNDLVQMGGFIVNRHDHSTTHEQL
jgi:hypothetical protein